MQKVFKKLQTNWRKKIERYTITLKRVRTNATVKSSCVLSFEKVAVMVLSDLHIILRKIEPPTYKELQAIIAEVEEKAFN